MGVSMLKRMALLSLFSGVLAGADQHLPYPAAGNGDRILSFNESAPYAQLAPNTTTLQWTAGGESDGHYFEKSKVGDIIRTDAVTGNTTVFVKNSQLSKEVRDYWFNADDKSILYATNSTKLWRYSYKADYFVVDVATGDKRPLDENQAGDIRYATFAPAGNTIAYVRNNDLHIQDADGTNHRITTDGGPTKFNAIPDWTTEEEVLGDVYTMFYSPDGKKIAFWSADVSEVETYVLPDYMQGQKVAPLYPEFYDLRYPKPGSKNPVMSLSLLDVETLKVDSIPLDGLWGEETILGEIAWLTDAHSKFIYRAFNRVQDAEKFLIVDTETLESKTVREREDQSGWFENNRAIQYVGVLEGSCDKEFYIDLSDETGWMHIYLFAIDGGKPVQLTSGEWEVSYIANVDKVRGQAHFVAAKRHSTERHFYCVDFDTKKITPLVDDTAPGYWSAQFSSDGSYYLLSYDGPQIPFEQMYCINSTTPIRTVHSNEALYKEMQQYNLPNVTWCELEHPDGYSLNVKEILPINFDPSKKYPVLFTPYGGPNSQSTGKQFPRLDWDQYIASDPELQFIVYTVDNRGTGMKGREYRSALTLHLGGVEPEDQIWAIKELSSRHDYINTDKVGMWGWSYGGFLTAKTIEADSGAFTFGLITAPVTDFRLYATMWTERYMKKYEDNVEGYNRTAVSDTAGFHHAPGGVAVMHGTRDDNVHYQNTAALVDLLVGDAVSPSKLKILPLTDSDHSINYNGAYKFLYKFLTGRLYAEVQRPTNQTAHQWTRKGEKKN